MILLSLSRIGVASEAPAANASDRALIDAAIERHVVWLGGWERLETLRDITVHGELQTSGLDGPLVVRSRRDGHTRSEYDLGAIRGGTTVTPNEAYTLSTSGQPEPLGSQQAEEERRALARAFGLHLRGEGAVVSHQGTLEREGRTWEDLRFVYPNGDEFDLLLDPVDGSSEWQRNRVDNKESWIHLTDWREVDGLRLAFRQETLMENPTQNQLILVEKVEINTQIADALFARPAEIEKPIRIAEGTETGWSAIDLYRGRYLYLRGRVNGVETDLLLDSGAGMTVLDAGFAKELGLRTQGEVAALGAGGNSTASMASGVRLEVAGLVADSLTVAVIDLSGVGRMLKRPLPAIFGKEVFSNFIVDIDYPQARIRFLDPAAFRYDGSGRKVPLFAMEGGHREIEAQVEDLPPARFHLDTGNGGTIDIFGAYAQENRMLEGRSPVSMRLRGGVGGRTPWKVATLRSVTIAGLALKDVPATISDAGGGSGGTRRQAGSLGAGILTRFRVLFDYPSECLYLEPGRGWDDGNFRKDRSGLTVDVDGDGLTVVYVSPGSPAERAGWSEGDRIIAIDGEPIDPERYAREMSDWGEGSAGTEVTLTVAGGDVRRLVLDDYY